MSDISQRDLDSLKRDLEYEIDRLRQELNWLREELAAHKSSSREEITGIWETLLNKADS